MGCVVTGPPIWAKFGLLNIYLCPSPQKKIHIWRRLSFFFRSIWNWRFQTWKFRGNLKIFIGFSMKIPKIEIFEKIKKSKNPDFHWKFFEKSWFFDFSIFSKISIFWNFHWKSNEKFQISAEFSGLESPISNRPKKITKRTYKDSLFLRTRTDINIQHAKFRAFWWISATRTQIFLSRLAWTHLRMQALSLGGIMSANHSHCSWE